MHRSLEGAGRELEDAKNSKTIILYSYDIRLVIITLYG